MKEPLLIDTHDERGRERKRAIGAHRVALDYTCGIALKAFCRGI
jgi:hypothetical protein